jgi:hypothetical protein
MLMVDPLAADVAAQWKDNEAAAIATGTPPIPSVIGVTDLGSTRMDTSLCKAELIKRIGLDFRFGGSLGGIRYVFRERLGACICGCGGIRWS